MIRWFSLGGLYGVLILELSNMPHLDIEIYPAYNAYKYREDVPSKM